MWGRRWLGGGGLDAGTGINVDAAGDAYVNVFTGSNERPKAPGRPPGGNPFGSFPVTAGAFDPTYSGSPMSPAPSEAAAVKLDPTGTKLLYSTYIGGGPVAVVNPGDFAGTQPFGNVVDSSGNVYITGQTNADESTFPSGHGFGSIPGFDHVLNGGGPRPSTSSTPTDSFVVKLNAAGSNVDYATYLGGSGSEQSIGIDVNGAGSAYISGTTSSSDGTFPATNGPGSTYNGGPNDAFVAKLNPFGTGLDYAGFIGGSGDDQAQGANKVAFSGRIGSRALRPGRYQATLIATDATRHASRPKTITFTIVKR